MCGTSLCNNLLPMRNTVSRHFHEVLRAISSLEGQFLRQPNEYTTQNVMAACGFDMRFTYVLAGWEETTSDLRVIKNALVRDYKLIIPNGKYYLVDAGLCYEVD
ncbi:hypothetical protein UlMin_044019 [Ulmus minor]